MEKGASSHYRSWEGALAIFAFTCTVPVRRWTLCSDLPAQNKPSPPSPPHLSRFGPNMAALSFFFPSSDVTTMHSYGWMLKPDGARKTKPSTCKQKQADQAPPLEFPSPPSLFFS